MTNFDLIIIGTGSGNSILTAEYDDWNVAIVERDVFGGTCLNRGCIPSKMFVYAADVAEIARRGPKLGVDTTFNGVDWLAIRDRVFDRIDPIAEGGERYRQGLDHVTVVSGSGRFTGMKQLEVNGETLTAETFVLAAGARVTIPPIPGLSDTPFHSSDTIMRVDALPGRLGIIGGGYIASELGHVFGSFGSAVTILNRSHTLLRSEDSEIRTRFTESYSKRFDVRLNTSIHEVRHTGSTFEVDISVGGVFTTEVFDELLVATGRTPNADDLNVAATGVALNTAGYVVVDGAGRTNIDGIWSLGDISNPSQLKHTANAEARIVAHNIVHADDIREVDLRFVPHAVFGHPQVASVGVTEEQAIERGIPYVAKTHDFGGAAYGWAMEDTESLCKVIAHAETRQLIGAHILGPQASTLIQQLIQGMAFGQTVDEMARGQLYIHPALSEVVEQALLDL